MDKNDAVTQAALALIGALVAAGGKQRWADWEEAKVRGVYTDLREERDDAEGKYRLATSDGRSVIRVDLDTIL